MIRNKKIKRIFHTWDKWECYPAGFYNDNHETLSTEECKNKYKELLSDLVLFEWALMKVITQWKNSCEHYLTNENMNRIAWLGQASICIELKIPRFARSGYFLLSKEEQKKSDDLALVYLNKWLLKNNYDQIDITEAGVNAKSNIY